MGWTYLTSRLTVNKTGWTADSTWRTASLATQLNDASIKAIMVHCIHNGSTTSAGIRGATCTQDLSGTLRNYGQRFLIIPLNDNQEIQYSLASTSHIFYIVATSTSKTGLVEGALTDQFNTTTGSYQTASPSGLPTDAEIAYIIAQNATTSGKSLSLKEDVGYLPFWANCTTAGFADATNGSIKYKQEVNTENGFYGGYIENGKKLAAEGNYTLTSATTTITAAEVPAGSTMAILRIRNTSGSVTPQMFVRAYGSSDTAPTYALLTANNQLWWLVGLDASKRFQVVSDANYASITVDVIGYVQDLPTEITVEQCSLAWRLGPVHINIFGKASGRRFNFEMEM
jgi:hypothetical protein